MRTELEFDPETLRLGDTVKHADTGDATGIITGFPYYPFATVAWHSTGNESDENLYYLTKA